MAVIFNIRHYDELPCVTMMMISVYSVLWLSPPPLWTTAVEHYRSRLVWSSHWQSPPPPGCSTHSYTRHIQKQSLSSLEEDLWDRLKKNNLMEVYHFNLKSSVQFILIGAFHALNYSIHTRGYRLNASYHDIVIIPKLNNNNKEINHPG